jgi:MoaA/NifB/PqqE/SkfB family radical SAM enzyme
MTVAIANQIKQFLSSNNITIATIMGGEFFCNPKWEQIFEALIPGLRYVRLVSNGDWAEDTSIPKFLKKFDNLKVSISKDQWHNNKKVGKAVQLCKKYNLNHNIASVNEVSEESIVPVGRSMD